MERARSKARDMGGKRGGRGEESEQSIRLEGQARRPTSQMRINTRR